MIYSHQIEVPRKRNEKLEEEIRKATLHLGLQEVFILKCVKLEELLAVRHCVFFIDNAGTGKFKSRKLENLL